MYCWEMTRLGVQIRWAFGQRARTGRRNAAHVRCATYLGRWMEEGASPRRRWNGGFRHIGSYAGTGPNDPSKYELNYSAAKCSSSMTFDPKTDPEAVLPGLGMSYRSHEMKHAKAGSSAFEWGRQVIPRARSRRPYVFHWPHTELCPESSESCRGATALGAPSPCIRTGNHTVRRLHQPRPDPLKRQGRAPLEMVVAEQPYCTAPYNGGA